jgi:glycosyltransferase involved in cell wall biosynthesis
MSVIIFGNGPMPNEPEFAVMAPGSRTWQIVRTVAWGLAESGSDRDRIIVLALDETPRAGGNLHQVQQFSVRAGSRTMAVEYRPMRYEEFRSLADADPGDEALPADVSAVVATGSAQPYSTAARFARRKNLPLWVDVFGDPIAETQSQLELMVGSDQQALDNKLVHVWKLMLDGLLQGDQFYGLSRRQRHALQGQLGCAGRLSQFTSDASMCHYLPYAVFEDDAPLAPRAPVVGDQFTIMWCGSFNTWMDVPTLTKGLTDALKANPALRLLVVGGRIAGYNEISYNEFLAGIKQAGVEGSVTLMDWQPLKAMQNLYAQCDLGLSIDRFTYEAELGSRTRLINFLAAGLPVASTVVTELSQELEEDGVLFPFKMGDAESLTRVLLEAADLPAARQLRGKGCRDYVLARFNAERWGRELRQWVAQPRMAADKRAQAGDETTNMLKVRWHEVREPLGL